MNDSVNMIERVKKFFIRKDIDPTKIKYILHEEGKTFIYLLDGRKISTYTTAADIMAVLNENDFFFINRGTYVAISEVAHIDENIYTMSDGMKITGRAYQMEEHDNNKLKLVNHASGSTAKLSIHDKFSGLDNMPVAFCVMEVIKDSDNNVEFIFRYCNQAMATLDGFKVSDLIGKSVYDIYEQGDKMRLAAYANVALTGRTYTLERINPTTGVSVNIFCYQPQPGFCACLVR